MEPSSAASSRHEKGAALLQSLAAAVGGAGGLGLTGGGCGDRDWLERQFEAAGNARVGVGFITWSLARNSELLDIVLERKTGSDFSLFS